MSCTVLECPRLKALISELLLTYIGHRFLIFLEIIIERLLLKHLLRHPCRCGRTTPVAADKSDGYTNLRLQEACKAVSRRRKSLETVIARLHPLTITVPAPRCMSLKGHLRHIVHVDVRIRRLRLDSVEVLVEFKEELHVGLSARQVDITYM